MYIDTHIMIISLMFISVMITLGDNNTYTLNVQIHVMDLARGTYSSVHVPLGACLAPSDEY